MKIKRLPLEEWKKMVEAAHLLTFKEVRHRDTFTCHYALLVLDENEVPLAYSTVLEMDDKSAYMQHGGALPGSTKLKTPRAYHLMIAYLRGQYQRISTRILNTNFSMLKLAWSAELMVTGIDVVGQETFLNLRWEKSCQTLPV